MIKYMLFVKVVQCQMRLEMSHIFKLSDTAFCLAPPSGGCLVSAQIAIYGVTGAERLGENIRKLRS